VTLSVTLVNPGQVNIGVYSLSGILVRELDHTFHPAGNYTLQWDGTSDSGVKLSPGVYFCRMKAGESSLVRKVVIY
jgi:flagellar hook assembly protein FlgD